MGNVAVGCFAKTLQRAFRPGFATIEMKISQHTGPSKARFLVVA